MKTKTSILTALVALASGAGAMAQVYSQNVVGYANVTVPATSFKLIANPLDTSSNTLGELLPAGSVPDGTQFYKFTGSGWVGYTYDDLDAAWLPDGNVTLNPGEGGFIRNNSGAPFTMTFVGEVMQGTLTNPLPVGYSVRGSMVPQEAGVDELGLPVQDGDQLFKYVSGSGYTGYTYDGLDAAWLPSTPTIAVGESVFIRKNAAEDWVRTYSVN